VRYVIAVILLTCAAQTVHAMHTQTERASEEVPLREQLDGLDPEPRIAYLRYLLREGGADAEIFFQLGVAYHELTELDSALFYYRSTIAVAPDHVKAYVNMGVVYDERGRYAEALAMFESAVRKDTTDVLAHAHAAYIKLVMDDYEGAWQYLTRALELAPEDPQPRFYLAIFFWESGIYREAMREWERVIELDEDGYLAGKARENLVMLQQALSAPGGSGDLKPER
jgi:tetratricopeptide (TPR) repeat protein